MRRFSYDEAFDRNIGWVTAWEQQALRFKRAAIAGMGGVGGVHMLTLARFGIGAFNISDFDRFDYPNFNRQIGANVTTVGRPKAEVLEEMARAINPEIRVRRFDQGINEQNVDAFLEGADVFIDGFDFFVLDIRRKVYQRCAELGIPALCAAPIGMGVGFLAFLPGQMSFESYFRFAGQPETEQYLRFLVGLVPKALHRSYLVDPSRLDLAAQRGPSTGASVQLCSGVAAVTAVKLMLRRGEVPAAPYHHHYDPFVGRLAVSKLRWGNAGPLQRLKLGLGRKSIAALAAQVREPAQPAPASPVEEILRAARWAPSGDNVQPWRFALLDDESVRVTLGQSDSIYEYRDGEPTVIAGGVLLESLRIAASGFGRAMHWHSEERRTPTDDVAVVASFPADPAIRPDRWLPSLMTRSVQRGRYRTRRLSGAEKAALEEAAGPHVVVEWHEATRQRLRLAALGARATDVRLRAPEAFGIHQKMLDFKRKHSPDAIPARAVGLDAATLRLMRWAMQEWSRAALLNRFAGPWSVAAQIDLLTGLASSAFFTMRLANPVHVDEDRVDALLGVGQAVQRFWLEAEHLGLVLQPALAVIAFAQYGDAQTPFTADPDVAKRAARLAARFRSVLGCAPESLAFIGRIGEPRRRRQDIRSTRRELRELVVEDRRRPTRATDERPIEAI